MNTLRRSIVSCFILAAASMLDLAAIQAQTVSPMPAPTIITSAPYTIASAGYYQLGADLNYAGTGAAKDAIITIAASNVTLDLGGHYISGPVGNAATTLYGVYADEQANLVIQNGTISHCEFGVYLDGNGTATSNNHNGRVQNLLVKTCTVGGIFGKGPINTLVSGCTINAIGGTSLSGQNATGVFFEGTGAGNQFNGNTVTTVTASASSAGGLVSNGGTTMTSNVITDVTNTTTAASAYGIFEPVFALNNQINNCYIGIQGAVKYKDNLTSGCTTSFTGGTAVGTNN